MKKELEEFLQAVDDMKVYAFGWLCFLLIAGSVWIELARRAIR